MTIKHTFVSAKADGSDASLVKPSNWNADHVGTATPDAHKTSHQNAGTDEISVTGLSGLLADDQHVLDAEVLAVAEVSDAITKKHTQNTDTDLSPAHKDATTGVHGVGAGTIAKTADIVATKLDDFTAPDDNTDLNTSTSKHGLCPKLDNVATNFLNGQGGWSAPAGGGGDIGEGHITLFPYNYQSIGSGTWAIYMYVSQALGYAFMQASGADLQNYTLQVDAFQNEAFQANPIRYDGYLPINRRGRSGSRFGPLDTEEGAGYVNQGSKFGSRDKTS